MDINLILSSIGVFLVIILLVVTILLVAKKYLSPSGNVNITINGKDTISVEQGGSLLSTLAANDIYLPSACGGKGYNTSRHRYLVYTPSLAEIYNIIKAAI